MGNRYQASCGKCGYEEVFYLGNGLKDCSLDHVMTHFQDMDRNLWKFLSTYREVDFLSFRFELGICEECGGLVRVPVISFQDGKDFVGGVCGKCGSLLAKKAKRIPEAQYESLTCPNCHERLAFEWKGLWD